MSNPEQAKGPDLGGLVIENGPPASGPALAQDVSGNASASARTIEGRKKRSDAGQPRGARSGASQPSVPAIPPSAFAKIYEPEIWSRALSAPADAMAAISGKKHWEISDKEREHLGVTGALAAQVYAVSDPRGLAVALALITIIDVYGVRLMMDLADRKKEREAAAAKKARGE